MIVLIVLLLLIFGVPYTGVTYQDGAYRGYGFGLGGLLLAIVLVLLVIGRIRI